MEAQLGLTFMPHIMVMLWSPVPAPQLPKLILIRELTPLLARRITLVLLMTMVLKIAMLAISWLIVWEVQEISLSTFSLRICLSIEVRITNMRHQSTNALPTRVPPLLPWPGPLPMRPRVVPNPTKWTTRPHSLEVAVPTPTRTLPTEINNLLNGSHRGVYSMSFVIDYVD